ncbi:MAG: hypothetical protein C4325_07335 [Blastocatellia bacterium]
MVRRILLSAIILVSPIACAFAQVDEPGLVIDSSVVILNVSVKDSNGTPVTGLSKSLFSVLEDGIEQKIDYFSASETPFAAVILLDTSGSMEERVALARSAAVVFLDNLRPEDVAAIYRFDSKIEEIQPFSNSRDAAEAIFDLTSKGMTRLNDAIYEAAVELSKRAEKRRAIIVLSDGQDTMSKRSADKALKAALAADATIYTVDMSPIGDAFRAQNQAPLKFFAEKTGGTFIATPGGAALRDAFRKIADDLGVQYTIVYSPTNAAKDGKWRSIEVKIRRPNLVIRTRKGYYAEKGK